MAKNIILHYCNKYLVLSHRLTELQRNQARKLNNLGLSNYAPCI